MGAELLFKRSTAQRQGLIKTASSDSTQIQREAGKLSLNFRLVDHDMITAKGCFDADKTKTTQRTKPPGRWRPRTPVRAAKALVSRCAFPVFPPWARPITSMSQLKPVQQGWSANMDTVLAAFYMVEQLLSDLGSRALENPACAGWKSGPRRRCEKPLAGHFTEASIWRLQDHSHRKKTMHPLTKNTFKTVALFGALTMMGAAHAAIEPDQGTWGLTLQARDIDKDGKVDAYYDTALKITWLRAGSISTMNWSTADAWAKQDRFGLSGWRLPTTVDKGSDGCTWSETGGTDCGYNPDSSVATGSEMAHLFFVTLGNKSIYVPGTTDVQAGSGLSNTGHFKNLQSNGYWSGTGYAQYPNSAWRFGTDVGLQSLYYKPYGAYALAVRPGDVAAAVPEPETYALMLLGLGVVLVARRRRAL